MAFVLPDISTEDRLLALAQKGDKAAISRIYEAFFQPIYQFVRLQVYDPSLAEDIAADVFVTLVDKLGTHSGPRETLRGWLFKVARSEIYRQRGKIRNLPTETLEEWVPTSADDTLESEIIRSMDTERARQALRMLAAEQQEVLLLRFGEALSLEETSDVMGKSVAAIKSLQFRALSTLRQILGEMK